MPDLTWKQRNKSQIRSSTEDEIEKKCNTLIRPMKNIGDRSAILSSGRREIDNILITCHNKCLEDDYIYDSSRVTKLTVPITVCGRQNRQKASKLFIRMIHKHPHWSASLSGTDALPKAGEVMLFLSMPLWTYGLQAGLLGVGDCPSDRLLSSRWQQEVLILHCLQAI